MALAFEQQRKESDKAFAAFSVYLSQGPARSLAKTAAKLGRSKVLMEKWSSKFEWPARVAAYNSHMALVEREAAEAMVREKGVDWAKRYQELREAEWRERWDLVVFAAEVRRRWMLREERCGTLEGYARLLELASKLGHSACEKATERAEVTGPEGGPIRVDVVAALKKIYGKPLPGEVVEVQEVRSEGAATGRGLAAVPEAPREARALPQDAGSVRLPCGGGKSGAEVGRD